MANPKMTKQWFTLAVRDLKAARALLSMGSDFKSGAVFHAQQCAEKAIKGFLVFNEIRPPKTHSVRILADLVTGIDEQLAKQIAVGEKLSKYAVEYRYPDAAKKPITVTQAKAAVKLAQKIYDELQSRITG